MGEWVQVWADVFADGHDVVQAALQYKHERAKDWDEVRATPWEADRWTGRFQVAEQGTFVITIPSGFEQMHVS